MNTERFSDKVIISGLEVEHYEYLSKMQVRGYKRKPRKEKVKEEFKKQPKENTEKTKFSVNRTRTQIRRLTNTNYELNKFLTLTSKITDIDKSNKIFNLFTQRMKTRYPKFMYIAVLEFQKDIDHFGIAKPDGGAVHYHIICNIPYVKSKELEEIWGQGFIKIKRIKKDTNLGDYLCKYLQKEMFDKRMFGKKKFFCSRDLKRFIELIGETAKQFMNENSTLTFVKKRGYSNEYAGDVSHKFYKMKKPIA
jgi:hypothetical protein